MPRPNTVEEYIASAPKELQSRLNQLRQVIRTTAPQAEEKISYGMPYYGYKGRLAYFAYAKEHIGLYIPPPIIEDHKSELKNYGTAKSTVRFPNTEGLPLELIKKLIKDRIKHNDESKKK